MKNLILIISMCVGLSACAQYSQVQQVHVVFKKQLPGNIPVDENGKPMPVGDTTWYVYMECIGKYKPVLKQVCIGNRCFTGKMVSIKRLPPGVGVWNPASKLWMAQLSPVANKSKSKNITVAGTLNGKSFKREVDKAIELEPEERY